jgi:hypothetical protein
VQYRLRYFTSNMVIMTQEKLHGKRINKPEQSCR